MAANSGPESVRVNSGSPTPSLSDDLMAGFVANPDLTLQDWGEANYRVNNVTDCFVNIFKYALYEAVTRLHCVVFIILNDVMLSIETTNQCPTTRI